MKRRIGLALAAMATAAAIGAAPARADQSPPGCTTSAVALSVSRDVTTVRSGNTVVYTVSVGNDGFGGCDITNAAITLRLPDSTGAPGGVTVPIALNLSLLSGVA